MTPSTLEKLRGAPRFLIERDWSLARLGRRFAGMRALEPGGPSELFQTRGLVPVYPRLASLDVMDFAESTLWSPSQSPATRGRQPQMRRLIGEAGRPRQIGDGSYEAVLASHVIEHIANPIGALREWARVVGPSGLILLVVPHMEGTFDHLRPATSVEHLLEDAAAGTGEDDTTHFEEVLALHDLTLDPGSPDRTTFEQRCRENLSTRAVHHHTFTTRLVYETCLAAGLSVEVLRPRRPFNIVCLCSARTDAPLDEGGLSSILAASPFASDRAG